MLEDSGTKSLKFRGKTWPTFAYPIKLPFEHKGKTKVFSEVMHFLQEGHSDALPFLLPHEQKPKDHQTVGSNGTHAINMAYPW